MTASVLEAPKAIHTLYMKVLRTERLREREERERRSAERPVIASAGNPFKLGNAKRAAKVLSDQSLSDGRFQLSPPPVVALDEMVACVL